MRWMALFVVLLLAANVAAIKMLEDKRPADVPKDAQIKTLEDLSESPKTPPEKTNMTIERIMPETAFSGDTFTVAIKVTNNHKSKLNILVVDPQRAGVEYIGGPKAYTVRYESYEFPIFRWEDTIAPGETKTYSYQIRAGSPGTITFPPASVNDEFGNVFESRPAYAKIGCKPDGACGPGENYIFCPQDCETGAKDDSCDGVEDGKIDPDCAGGADPDAQPGKTATTLASSPSESTSTLPLTMPLKKPESTGCVPLILAPLTLLAVTLGRTLQLI